MSEELTMFKGYSRGLLRQLAAIKEAIQQQDQQKAEILLGELIEDTKKNIDS